jgi:hypothetical protein
MKGLALILGKAGSPKGGAAEPEKPEAPEEKSGSSEREYARLASEAIADGDHDAAADALVSMVKACMGSYGPK